VSEPVLAARGLSARVGDRILLDRVDLALAAGEVLAVVGASGSGKTTLGLALQGERRGRVQLDGSVRLFGEELLDCREARRRAVRAGRIASLPQHPAAVLNPARRVGRVLGELAALRHPRAERKAAVRRALHRARLDADPALLNRYPHQLSGGQQQRLALAQALVTEPRVVVLDEPSTGLDTVTKEQIAVMLGELAESGTGLLLLTHDAALVRMLAHDVRVLRDGKLCGRGGSPVPTGGGGPPVPPAESRRNSAAVLQVSGLGRRTRTGAVLLDGVDLQLQRGRCLAVVGPSGAGKTTLARCVAGLCRPTAGRIVIGGELMPPTIGQRSRQQRSRVQYVHQDARSSFDPRRKLLRQVARTAELLRSVGRHRAEGEAREVLARLGIPPGQVELRAGELSGGQLQRAALARALLAEPEVLVLDEVTSSLDAASRAELLALLRDWKSSGAAGVVFISHDLASVTELADEVAVIANGRCVETGSLEQLLTRPVSAVGRELVVAARASGELGPSPVERKGVVSR
jgi:peptide/nickel transport system ATP-binding protein